MSELSIVVASTGETLDADGYVLVVDAIDSLAVATDDSVSLTATPADTLDLWLTQVAPNCSVDDNPRSVTPDDHAPTLVSFQVLCQFAIHNQLVAASERSGNMDIYVMNPDGSEVTQLTHSDSLDVEPTVSPDGTKIAFSSARESTQGRYDIFVSAANGEGPVTNITNNPAMDREPSWSPDGNKIAFISDRDGDYEVFTMNTDGSNILRLTDNTAEDYSPSWSPTGDKILFSSDREGGMDVYVMQFDGSGVTRLSFNSDNWYPRFAPDEQTIAFSTARYGFIEIATMNATGSAVTRLTYLENTSYHPTWSPDGSRIAFTSWSNSALNVFVMNADGSDITDVTQSQYYHYYVQWSLW